jgi:hypothetical protein
MQIANSERRKLDAEYFGQSGVTILTHRLPCGIAKNHTQVIPLEYKDLVEIIDNLPSNVRLQLLRDLLERSAGRADAP